MINNTLAFIDEYGDTCLDLSKDNISSLFIITAIIINETQKEVLEQGLQEIRDKYFQGSEIKSNKIGSDDRRRKLILEKVKQLDFKCYTYVIDKAKLNGKGFSFRQPFYKFAHNIVDRELFSTIPHLQIYTDEIGSRSYMKSFVKYIFKKYPPTLFDNNFVFADSKQTSIVQLADFVAGTLGRCYDTKKLSPHRAEFTQLLADKILSVNTWPVEYAPSTYTDASSDVDHKIRDVSIQKAKSFLYENAPKQKMEYFEEQKVVVEYLLFYLLNIDSKRFVSSRILLSILRYNRVSRIKSANSLMQKIIAPLRDNKVLVASSKGTNSGYKLPSSLNDINDFIDTFDAQIAPMLSRIQICQEVLKLASLGELDILKQEKYKHISKIMAVVAKKTDR